MSQKSNQKYTWRGAKWIFYALPRLFLRGWIHRRCWRKGKGITVRKWGLRYLNDVFIGRLALDKGWDIGDCPIHLYGDHFDRNGHGASGQDGCVDDLGVLQGKEKWIYMRQQEAGNGFPGYFISVHDLHVCSLHCLMLTGESPRRAPELIFIGFHQLTFSFPALHSWGEQLEAADMRTPNEK